MNMEFATAAQVQEGFGTGLTAMVFAVSAMAIAAYAGGRHLATPLRLNTTTSTVNVAHYACLTV